MTLILLGLTTAEAHLPDAPPHQRILAGGYQGLALPLDEATDWSGEAGTIALAQAQHRLLCDYARRFDVLPVAIGAVFSGREAVSHHIEQERGAIDTLAARFFGRVEYALSIDTRPEAAPTSAETGRAHLRRRASLRTARTARGSARRAFLETMSGQIADAAETHRVIGGRSPGRFARIDFLVRRDRWEVCRYAIEMEEKTASDLNLDLALTGPYPAFSFATEQTHE